MRDKLDLKLSQSNQHRGFIAIGSALALIVMIILFLPIFQALFYTLFIAHPEFLQWSLISLIIAVVGIVLKSQRTFIAALVVFVVMAVFVGPIAAGVYTQTDIANQMQQDATELETLPNTSQNHVRVLPRQVADNYASSSLQKPQYRLTNSDIAYNNGTYTWSYGVVPNNFIVSLTGNQNGAMYVNMQQTSKQTSITGVEFNNGRGQIWFDSYTYQSVLHNPMVLHKWDTTFNSQHNGKSYIAHSTVGHKWKFRLLPIPQLYAVPHHGTVEVMETDGSIESLTPKEAHKSERLEGQNYYPYSLAMLKVESMKMKHGAINKWFYKEDVLAIADLPSGGNNWPLTVPTETKDGPPELTYFIATEPTGSGNGVYEIWTFNGQTGEAGVQQYSESQIGPQKAIDFVERQPQVNRLSSATPVSPVPIVQDGTLYWHVKVIPKSESGIIYTAFVNAGTGDVTLVEGTEPIYAFLSQEEVDEVKDKPKPDGETMTVTVVVTDSQGNINKTTNITIPKGGSANIKIENKNETSTNNSSTTDSGR